MEIGITTLSDVQAGQTEHLTPDFAVSVRAALDTDPRARQLTSTGKDTTR
jgi:hypothetical protein